MYTIMNMKMDMNLKMETGAVSGTASENREI